jgi:hypothetical protein
MAVYGFIKPTGEACKALPMKGEGWCYVHHPSYQEQRRRAGAKGGHRGGRGRPRVELVNLKSRLSNLADDVLEGKVDKGTAAVASQVLNVYLRAVSVELKVKEQEEILGRVEELEALLEARNQEGQRWGS